jgi:phosphoadenosine phosphosulfate reductase
MALLTDSEPTPGPFLPASFTDAELADLNREFEKLPASKVIQWAADAFGPHLALAASMTDAVLIDLAVKVAPAIEVLFIDTGYHFFETLRMRDQTLRAWRLNVVTLYPEITTEEQETRFGKKLFTCNDGQPECCRMRKEAPLLRHLSAKTRPVLVNGLRREEGGKRGNINPLDPDPRTGGHQLSPLFDWSAGDIDAYIAAHDLPVHPLYAQCYASIGCYPCTTPIRQGEDARAGRWRHLRPAGEAEAPPYCGVNFSDGSGI